MPHNTQPASSPGARGRVLVVDDDPHNRRLVVDCLAREGYSLVEAEDGLDALEHMAAEPFDAVVLDLDMPVLGGFDVLHRMKERRFLRDTPVIIVSGWNDTDQILQGIRDGAVDHLGKPFNPLLLRTRVHACVERKRWHDQERAYMEQIRQEREKAEKLLLNILPRPIAQRLKNGETTIADSFSEVTVLFADLVGFTSLSSSVSPELIVGMLNEVFTCFDGLAQRHGLEKIKTIGDCYMAVSGLPVERPDHAPSAAAMALDILREIERLNEGFQSRLRIRVGLHTGLVVAGVIGKNKFIYDLWGDTVNLASRMESHSEPGRIQVSEATCERLKNDFVLEARGEIEVKGKGPMPTWWLLGRKAPRS
jgi:adenylate cyclase